MRIIPTTHILFISYAPHVASTRFLFIFYVAAATISPHGMVFAEVVGHNDKVSMLD